MKDTTSSKMGQKEGKIGSDPEELREGKSGKVELTINRLMLYKVEGKVICGEWWGNSRSMLNVQNVKDLSKTVEGLDWKL